MNDYRNDYKNYLMHYGVKGMKWGVRRYQDKNGRLTPEGREHYGYGKSKKNDVERGALTPLGMGILAVYGGIYAATLGTILFGPSIKKASENQKDKKRCKELYKSDNPNNITPKELKKINPKYGKKEYSNNCVKCSIVTELLARGETKYQAGKSNGGFCVKDYLKWFKGAKAEYIVSTVTGFKQAFDKYESGSSGILGICYEGGMGGHEVHWTKLPNGSVRIEDGQVGYSYNIEDFFKEYKPASGKDSEIIRLDNCEPDYQALEVFEVVEERSKK